jgi:hypothetical protein
MLLFKNIHAGTLMIRSYGQLYPKFHQDHAHRNPFPSRMISNYYFHSSMALLFLPFVSMLLTREYKLTIVSEEERRTRENKNKTNHGKKMNKREV